MLKLNSITLVQFKNYIHKEFHFNSRIVGISGANGIGKTNLLDAIYYLCFTKSYFGRTDAQSVCSGFAGFRIEGHFTISEQEAGVVCIFRETGKKEVLLNGDPYERFAQHIGKFPLVIIAPDDVRIITEGSEERRRFIDAILSQLNAEYLQKLINYNRVLQQRNSYLRSMNGGPADSYLLETYDQQLAGDGTYIFEERSKFMSECISRVYQFYRQISASEEDLRVKYESQLTQQGFRDLLAASRDRDIFSQRTNTGIHKDDLIISLQNRPFKVIASQGQRKSLLFAMKLSEFSILQENKGFAPLLLLDDVFEKLDELRMHNLLDWVCVKNGGQIFITDTHRERIEDHFGKLGVDYQILSL